MSTRRIDLQKHAGTPFAAMVRLEERIKLNPRLRALVTVRASTIASGRPSP